MSVWKLNQLTTNTSLSLLRSTHAPVREKKLWTAQQARSRAKPREGQVPMQRFILIRVSRESQVVHSIGLLDPIVLSFPAAAYRHRDHHCQPEHQNQSSLQHVRNPFRFWFHTITIGIMVGSWFFSSKISISSFRPNPDALSSRDRSSLHFTTGSW